jgi:O-antigen ligase
LFTLSHRNNKYLLKEPVSILLWTYLALVLLSVLFSIDPLFSFFELKDEPLKSALLFPVIVTVMNHEEKLKKVIHVSFFALIMVVLSAYYSYMFHDIEVLKPDTFLVHAWHGRFGRYLCMLLPLSFILFFIWKGPAPRIFLIISLAGSFIALLLSTSRTGIAASLMITFVWALYFSRKRERSLIKIMTVALLAFSISVMLAYHYVPDGYQRIRNMSRNLYTLSDRTEIWVPAIYAIREKPVTGWGYGERIFHMEEPYANTPYREPPVKGPHNSFIGVLFHQGMIGFIPYTLMIIGSIIYFWQYSFRTTGLKSYMLISCASILIANYLFQAMLSSPKLIYLVIVLGLGMAAKGINEDSDH